MYSRIRIDLRSHPGVFIRLIPVLALFTGVFVVGIYSAVRQSLGFVPGAAIQTPTLEHFQTLLTDPWFRRSAGFSLRVATWSTLVSVVAGVPLAYLMWRLPESSRKWGLIYKVPIILPHIAVAFIAMVALTPSGLLASLAYKLRLIASQSEFPNLIYSGSELGIVAAFAFKEVPFVVLMCLGVLPGIPVQMLQTASMLGAGSARIFFRVILPELFPIINTTCIILFLYSFGSFDIPYLLGGSDPGLLPVYVYNLYFHGSLPQRPLAMAALVLVFLFALLFTIVYSRIAARLDDGMRKV